MSWAAGGGDGELFSGCRVSVWEDERALEMRDVTAMRIRLMALNCALKHGRSGQCYVKCILPQF